MVYKTRTRLSSLKDSFQNKYNLKRQLKQRYFFFLLAELTALAKLDLRLAAAFLCKTPLLKAISMTLYALLSAVRDSSLFAVLAATSVRAERIEVFQLRFISRFLSAILTLFMADLILGTANFS
jgi:hypothetical protein